METNQAETSPYPSIIVEPAKPSDAEEVFDVQRLTWLDTYPNDEADITEEDIRLRVGGKNGELIPKKIERWKRTIEGQGDENCAVFVARLNDKVVGFVAPGFIEGQRRVGAIYVLPEAQGKGAGAKLMKKALEWHGNSDDIYLHVADYNHNAITFYKQFGFIETDKKITDDVAKLNNSKSIPEIEMVKPSGK
jgi:GNAT superfamily N-acetyltransferase